MKPMLFNAVMFAFFLLACVASGLPVDYAIALFVFAFGWAMIMWTEPPPKDAP